MLVVYGPNWAPQEVPVQVGSTVKCLGDLALTGQTHLDISTDVFVGYAQSGSKVLLNQ